MQLPERPSLDHLRHQARNLQKASKLDGKKLSLWEAQLRVAQTYGFASWAKLKQHVELLASQNGPKPLPANPSLAKFKREAKLLAQRQPSLSIEEAQNQLAKSYGFTNWDGLCVVVTTLATTLPNASKKPLIPGTPPASEFAFNSAELKAELRKLNDAERGGRVIQLAMSRMKQLCEEASRKDLWTVFENRVIHPMGGLMPKDFAALQLDTGLNTPLDAMNALVTAKWMFARALEEVVGEYMDDPAEVRSELVRLDHNARKRSTGTRFWIEPLPTLEWQKTGQCTVIASLTVALSVLDHGCDPLGTPRERTLLGTPARTGPAWDYNTLMGDSAMAFRVRWHRRGGFGQTSAKPATWWAFTMAYAGGPEDEALLQQATGWQFFSTPYHYPNNAKPLEQLPAIRASIYAGRPVVACLPEEFGVIHGYDSNNNDVLVTAYQNPGKAYWMPIAEVGTKVLILAAQQTPVSRRDATVAALCNATLNWYRGHVPAGKVGIHWENETVLLQYGEAAYEEWADDLRHAGSIPERARRQLWNASAFNMTSLSDARWAAAGYLRQAKTNLPDSNAKHLEAAASIYEDLARQTSNLRMGREFFGVWSGQQINDWTDEQREKEAEMLKHFMQLDAAAIAEVRQAMRGLSSLNP